jgi:hypothetical protein
MAVEVDGRRARPKPEPCYRPLLHTGARYCPLLPPTFRFVPYPSSLPILDVIAVNIYNQQINKTFTFLLIVL